MPIYLWNSWNFGSYELVIRNIEFQNKEEWKGGTMFKLANGEELIISEQEDWVLYGDITWSSNTLGWELAGYYDEDNFTIEIQFSDLIALMEEYGRKIEEKLPIRIPRDEKIDEETDDATRSCAICLSNLKQFMINPCHHICLCYKCSQLEFAECPICRTKIKEIIHVFY